MATARVTESGERVALRDAVRRFLTDVCPMSEVRRLIAADETHDSRAWQRMADELGLQGLAIAVEYGGQGATLADLAVVLSEQGRALFMGPYFSSVVLAASAIACSGDERAMATLLPGIASGRSLATLAVLEADARWQPQSIRTSASKAGGHWSLDGVKGFVIDAVSADIVLVLARTEPIAADAPAAGLSLFAVDARAYGVDIGKLTTLDLTRQQGTVTLRGAPGQLIGTQGDAWPAIRQMYDIAALALAAEQVGGAARCLELTVAYAQSREAFGKPIGAFQAIKHSCADMWMLVQGATAAAERAAEIGDSRRAELPVAAAIARAYCSEAYVQVATQTVHIHGGIGFTWEHDAHLYLRRAHASAAMLATPDEVRELLLTELGV